jgi:hypothetical protein
VVCCFYRIQAPHLSGHMHPFVAHMQEGALHYLAFTWHGTLPNMASLGYLLHLMFVTYGLTCVSKTWSRHDQGYFWLRLVCLFLDMLWCFKGVRFIEWVEFVLPQSNYNVQIIYLSNNSSGDFTVAKKAPRSIKHLRKNPWSHFYITSWSLLGPGVEIGLTPSFID